MIFSLVSKRLINIILVYKYFQTLHYSQYGCLENRQDVYFCYDISYSSDDQKYSQIPTTSHQSTVLLSISLGSNFTSELWGLLAT